MKSISSRIVVLVATSAVAPLLIYGLVSVNSLRQGMREAVVAGIIDDAERAAEQIQIYVSGNVRILQSLGADLDGTGLAAWQQDRVLKNYVLNFPEFREITLFDAGGDVMATSRLGTPHVERPAPDARFVKGVHLSSITLDNDLLPTMTVSVRVAPLETAPALLVGEFNLVEMWRMVDRIRIGETGYALVATEDGRLIAHGKPDRKRAIARGESVSGHPLLRVADDRGTRQALFIDDAGVVMLAVAATLEELGWTVVIEQTEREALAVARRLERQLLVVIGTALLATIFVGYFWGRGFIRRIGLLAEGTRALAAGRLNERVHLGGEDELRQLGDGFNRMADRLVELQDDIRKQERQAMFGRIAVGLVHDLSHPIQNIANSCRLIVKLADDPDYRQTFRRTVDREVATIKRMLEDLRNLARPIPLERFPLDVNRTVSEVCESMRTLADSSGVALDIRLAGEPLPVDGDHFGLSRVLRNLIVNALQATAPGGIVTVTTGADDGRVHVSVADTGCGIPADRLGAIFDDFHTTKRRGLGLGLAISRKIVEQLDGRISVRSEVGKGSEFLVEFPSSRAPVAA
jgi:signal transduction histidine kinase